MHPLSLWLKFTTVLHNTQIGKFWNLNRCLTNLRISMCKVWSKYKCLCMFYCQKWVWRRLKIKFYPVTRKFLMMPKPAEILLECSCGVKQVLGHHKLKLCFTSARFWKATRQQAKITHTHIHTHRQTIDRQQLIVIPSSIYSQCMQIYTHKGIHQNFIRE